MGHVRVRIKLANPERREEAIEVENALVDTGATLTTVPRSLADQLRLEILGQHQTRTASGVQTVDQSYAFFEYDGRQTVTPIWISDTYPGVLIGVITLEALGLAVDPASGQLTDSEFLLLVVSPAAADVEAVRSQLPEALVVGEVVGQATERRVVVE